jgi:hypothetical protein
MRVLEGANAKAARERLNEFVAAARKKRGDDVPVQVTDVLIWQSGSDSAHRWFVYRSVKEYDGADPPSNLKVAVDNTKVDHDDDGPF